MWVAVESMLEVLAGLHAMYGVKQRQGEAGEAKRGDLSTCWGSCMRAAYWRKLAWDGMPDLMAEHAQEHCGYPTVFQSAKDPAPAGCPTRKFACSKGGSPGTSW